VPPGVCTNGARFVEDVTVPDGSVFAPGEEFDKRWAVRNDGTCDWGPDYRLVPIGGNPFSGAAEIALFPAQAATIGEWQIDLRAPGEPGEYLGRWQALAPDGTPFGDEVFVVIIVELPTPAPSPSPTVRP
jgi:next-to-BRCA1 protein 1